jgi:putative aldouronate transport system substrate-binding protein
MTTRSETSDNGKMLDRRAFVRLTGKGVLAGVVGVQLLLEACSSPAASPPAASAPTSAPAAPASAPASAPAIAPTSAPASGPTSAPASVPTAAAAPAAAAATSAPSGAAASAPAAAAGAQPKISGKNAAAFPSYAPITLPTPPDYHSDDPRITDGYDTYPTNPAKSWNKPAPGAGGTVNVFMVSYYPAPTAYDQNATWHEINTQLNANVQMSLVTAADYPVKIATVMADSNNLPDIIHIYNGIGAAPSLPDFFKAQCADLSPYLSGDAAKTYPNLAAIPTYAWNNSLSAIDGHLYQWPIHRYLPLQGLYKNSDVYDAAFGADYVPRDIDDYTRMLKQVNDPSHDRWAMGNSTTVAFNFGMYGYSAIFGAPNNWSLDASGQLVKDMETDQFKATVGWMRDTWAAGLWWPDSPSNTDSRSNFVAGKFVTGVEGFGNSWNDFWRRGLQQDPPRHFGFIKPFRSEAGAPPQAFLTGGFISTNVMKKASPDRIQELLRILDWLAAPFGTQEDLLLSYGLVGSDYTLDANNQPQPTPSGVSSAGYVPWRYFSQHPYVQYQADLPGYAKASFEAEQVQVNAGVLDPMQAYYSPTRYSKGTFAEMTFRQGVVDIVVGRRPLTDYDGLVSDWRKAAGDQMRKEYLDAVAANA